MLNGDATMAVWAVENGGNGHRYEVVRAERGISWHEAKADAEARGGHLATVTSLAENEFVSHLIDDLRFWNRLPVLGIQSHGPWIGGFRAEADIGRPLSEGWQWLTAEQWSYENWATFEPNRQAEQYVHYVARGVVMNSTWNNWGADSQRFPVISFVVEYEDDPVNEPPVFTSIPVTNAMESVGYEYVVTATDPENDPISIRAITLPGWLTVTDEGDGTGSLHGTPGFEDIGRHEVILDVYDSHSTSEQMFTVNVESIGQISGVLWHDPHGDGRVADDGVGLIGWTVYDDQNGNGQLDPAEQASLTDLDGRYVLQSLHPGTHTVRALAPIDESILDRYQLWYRRGHKLIEASLSDVSFFRLTPTGERSFHLEFEYGDDSGFDELRLQIEHADNGEISATCLWADRGGTFDLVDLQEQRGIRNFGRGRTAAGTQLALSPGWCCSSPVIGFWQFTTDAGQQVSQVDFAVVREQVKDEFRWAPLTRIMHHARIHHAEIQVAASYIAGDHDGDSPLDMTQKWPRRVPVLRRR